MKVPLTKVVGLKACPRALWLASQPTSGPVTCPADWKRVTLQPWGCAGVPLSPWALESAEWLCMSFEPCRLAAGKCVPGAGGVSWGEVVCPRLGSINVTASCKPNWGLLNFPPTMLPVLAWGARLEAASSPAGQGDGGGGRGSDPRRR